MASRTLRAPSAIAGAAGIFLLVGTGAQPGPARAEEGNQTLRQIFGLVTGDTGQKDTDGIDYRERPPLVLPPKMELPPPQAAVEKPNPAWPNDPDLGRLKKLKAEAKVPARQVNEATANPHISQAELEKVGSRPRTRSRRSRIHAIIRTPRNVSIRPGRSLRRSAIMPARKTRTSSLPAKSRRASI